MFDNLKNEIINILTGRHQDVTVTADVPPVAQWGSYALHKGINVKISPPPGKEICRIAADDWADSQIEYYEDYVVSGDLETSTGSTRGQFSSANIVVRDDGFRFTFPDANHPAGMPYAQLATFIEVQKGVPICTVNTGMIKQVVEEELLIRRET